MEDPLGVREGCRWVTERARWVRLGPLEEALQAILPAPVPVWDREHHYAGPRERTLRYLLVLDTVNFSFWRARPPGPSRPQNAHAGYRELAAALRGVFEAGDQLADPGALRNLSAERLQALLGLSLPMPEERAAALRELGRHGFDGLVRSTAAGTARAVAGALASYRDIADYGGRRIPILKRAQILAADLHGAGVRTFEDLASLTCFADYKLPQTLRHWGALVLAPELAGRVDAGSPLSAGEAAEVEIRCATVTAVERLREALAARGRELCSVEVDWILWEASQELQGMAPYPRTRTVFY